MGIPEETMRSGSLAAPAHRFVYIVKNFLYIFFWCLGKTDLDVERGLYLWIIY